MQIVTVATQKGGVGKTTTTINLGAALAKLGHRVLLADLCSQGNLSDTLGYAGESRMSMTDLIYSAVSNMQISYEDTIIHNEQEHLDFIPGTGMLAAAPTFMAQDSDSDTVLRRIFTAPFWAQNYDFIIFDCHPSLDLLASGALAASNGVIIPAEPDDYAIKGLVDLMALIMRTQQRTNPDLEIYGILLTKVNEQRNLTKEIRQELLESFAQYMFNTSIPFLVEAPKAAKAHRSCVSIKGSRVGQAYLNVAKEVLSHVNAI